MQPEAHVRSRRKPRGLSEESAPRLPLSTWRVAAGRALWCTCRPIPIGSARMYDDLQGKSIVITGAGAGIGRAAALAFGRAGARVMAADLDRERGEATVAAIHQAGGQAHYHQCDVSVSADVEALIAATVDAYGQLDCAYNNA